MSFRLSRTVTPKRLGHQHRAALAFETSLTMLPGLLNAHRWLAALYARPGGDMPRAQDHRRLAADLQKRRAERLEQASAS